MVLLEARRDLESILERIDSPELLYQRSFKKDDLVKRSDDTYWKKPLMDKAILEMIGTVMQYGPSNHDQNAMYEAIHNAARYGERTVDVTIHGGRDNYVISVRDDGDGFTEAEARSNLESYPPIAEVNGRPRSFGGGFGRYRFKNTYYVVSYNEKGNEIDLFCNVKDWKIMRAIDAQKK